MRSELPQDDTSCTKILHVPQLIIAINYLYRYSHFYKEGRIIINNALDMREWIPFYNTLYKKEWFCLNYQQWGPTSHTGRQGRSNSGQNLAVGETQLSCNTGSH